MAKRGNGRRPNDELTTLVAEHVDQLVAALRVHLQLQVAHDIQRYFADGSAPGAPRSRPVGGRRVRSKRILPCIAPGCQNPSKGPRFHYLCEKHRHASKKDYTAWQATGKSARKAAKSA